MTSVKSFIIKYKIQILLAVSAVALCVVYKNSLIELYLILTDREKIKAFIDSWGSAAPLVFIAIQIMQVIFAPVPGEISGFVGGYLFGATQGFIFSSVGLAVGSAINFWIGRILGDRFIRKMIPKAKREKLDRFITHQGVIVLLFLFMFPGFPKDYLCLLLGITTMPFKIFILLAGFGRMPGTLMLSLQGEFLFAQKYGVFVGVVLFSLAVVLLAFIYRKTLYEWAGQINHK
ncbi:MAG: TVP38/TMEM64 family protein [Dissulfuribacterales bacterium]